jgi:hypothetical protein
MDFLIRDAVARISKASRERRPWKTCKVTKATRVPEKYKCDQAHSGCRRFGGKVNAPIAAFRGLESAPRKVELRNIFN